MKLKSCFEVVDVAEEHLAIPLGEEVTSFTGIVALNDASAYLLSHMNVHRTRDDLVRLLLDEYDLTSSRAEMDVDRFIDKLKDLNMLES